MLNLQRLLGLILLVALLLTAFLPNGMPEPALIDLPSLVMVLGGMLVILLFGSEHGGWRAVWLAIFTTCHDHCSKRLARNYLLATGNAAATSGMIFSLCGLSLFLQDSPEIEQLPSGIGIAMIPLIYGLVLSHLIFAPLAKGIRAKGSRSKNDDPSKE